MKSINCELIQDLLPSYCDKISSNATNLLVEEHLGSCANCRKKFESLTKDLNIETLGNQQDEIDFLKGYRKRKRMSIIFAVTVVLIIMNIIFILLGNIFPKYFTGRDYPIYDLDAINLEYIYCVDEPSNSLMFYLYSDKYKELDAYINQILNPSTGGSEIAIHLVGKRELRPLAKRNVYASGYENSVQVGKSLSEPYGIDRILIEDAYGNKKEIWNKDTKVMSRDEWARWYVNSYVPQEVKDKYHLDYDTVMYKGHPVTGMWRHLYEPNLN